MRLRDGLSKLRQSLRRLFFGQTVDEVCRRIETCAMCGGRTDPARRWWSRFYLSWVCAECIPAYVARRGIDAVEAWLERGELPT